jgi:hypothetical protein
MGLEIYRAHSDSPGSGLNDPTKSNNKTQTLARKSIMKVVFSWRGMRECSAAIPKPMAPIGHRPINMALNEVFTASQCPSRSKT